MKMLRIPLVIVLLVVAGRTFHADAQTETILYRFGSSPTDGFDPQAGLVQGSDSNFYGTTYAGGTGNGCSDGCGTVFRISPSGTYTSLYSFGSFLCFYSSFGIFPCDGAEPLAGLVQGSDGNFYGTTSGGGEGATGNCPEGGCGTVFRISPSGTFTSLYSFAGYPNDGAQPQAGLVQGSDGNFYGTTAGGGTNSCYCGTVFRISPSGTYTSLYSFGGSPNDGANPEAGLVQGSDGNFYGTTYDGGSTNCSTIYGAGCGTVFRISPSGTETTLYSFGSSPTDGVNPQAGLVQGSDGNFYGTTFAGGVTSTNCEYCYGYGTVFRISPSGTFTSLYSFGNSPTDGFEPQAGLVQGSDGNFYGTTSGGGTYGGGIVFRISPSGSYTNLYSFGGSPNDGSDPVAGLVQGSDGNFYGTTLAGGVTSTNCEYCGTVFKLDVGLGPNCGASINPRS